MRVTSLLLALIVIAGSSMAPAATVADLAVFNVIRQSDPALVNDRVVYRNMVAPDLDLVIAIGNPAEWGPDHDSPTFYWGEKQKLGLFLQARDLPDRVYLLTLSVGFFDCEGRIERATSTDTVISCTSEKPTGVWSNQKFVYDVRAKLLISHFAYQPFPMMRIFNDSGRTVFVGIDKARLVAVEFRPDESPEFRILTNREAAPWLGRVRTSQGTEGMEQRQVLYLVPEENPAPIRFGEANGFTFAGEYIVDSHGKKYPLPQSTYEEYSRVHPELTSGGFVPNIQETIGPIQLEGDKLWFGKTFYGGEGYSGVGAFGYLDATDRQYHLFAPPEVADFSISAIRVEPDTVWMGIYHRGEYGDGAGGVIRYDRKTNIVRKYDLPDIVSGLVVSGDRVLAATSSGLAVIEANQTTRYFVDRTSDGRLRIAEATR